MNEFTESCFISVLSIKPAEALCAFANVAIHIKREATMNFEGVRKLFMILLFLSVICFGVTPNVFWGFAFCFRIRGMPLQM